MSFIYTNNLFLFLLSLIVLSCGSVENFTDLSQKKENNAPYVEQFKKNDFIKINTSIENNFGLSKKYLINNYGKKYNNFLPIKNYIIDNIIYSFNHKFELLQFDLNSGNLLSLKKIDYEFDFDTDILTSFITHNEEFFISLKSGLIIKINKNGKVLWIHKTDKLLNSNLLIKDERLIAIYADEVKTLSLLDGSEIWNETYNDLPIYQAKGGQLVDFFNLIYFILPNNQVGSIDLILGEKHFSNFDNIEFQNAINNTKDKIYIYENYLVYLDEGEYLYTFDIIKNDFVLYKHKIKLSSSNHFFNNSMIIKNENYLESVNILNGNTNWLIENKKLSKKAKIIKIKEFNNFINIFLNNGKLLRIYENKIVDTIDLKINKINLIYFQNEFMFISLDNGKTAIY